MVDSRFQDIKYVCWLKICMALQIVKEGLEDVTDRWKKDFHETLQDNQLCLECTTNQQPKSHKKGINRPRGHAACKTVQDYRSHDNKLEWSNLEDLSTVPSEAWKLFLPFGCNRITEVKHMDIAALLTLYVNNSFFLQKVGGKTSLLEQVKQIRNTVMHSAKMEVEAPEMKNYMATLIQLLQCHRNLSKDQDCQKAVDEITKLESTTLDISLNKEDEIRALKDIAKTAVTKADQANYMYTELKSDIEEKRKSDVKPADLDDLNAKHINLQTEVNKVFSELGDMKQSLADFLKANEIPEVDLQPISEKIKEMKNLLDDTIPTMKLDLDTLKTRITQCESRIDDHDEKISTLKHKVDDIGMFTKSKKQKMVDTEQCRNAIHERLLKVYDRNHKHIPIYPPRPSWKKPLDQMYVVQSLKVTDHRGRPDKNIIENDCEAEVQWVKSFYDIFYSKESPNLICKNIMLSGEAGSGKSTLCEHMVNTWGRSKRVLGTQSAENTETDEEFMNSRFSYLFFINLRDVNLNQEEKKWQIAQMIQKMYEFPDSYLETIDDILAEPSTLVVFDALDESKLKSLPYRSFKHECVIVTTSRPWKIETLRSEIEIYNIERHIEIIGLEENATSALARKVTQLLNEEFKKQKESATFLKEMKDKCLEQFMKIPVLVMHMLCLWYDEKPFGNSQVEIYGKLIHNHVLADIKIKQLSPHSGSSRYGRFPLYCVKKGCQCSRYSDILWSLSQLSFDALLDDNRENSLVFDHDQMDIHNMSEEDVAICLKVGLLTQHMLYGAITEEQKALGFIHKTHQEYFAAAYLAYICTDSNLRQTLNDKIDSLDRVLELEKVLMFVSGMKPDKASIISDFLMEKASEDKRVVEYRLSGEWEVDCAPNDRLIRRIQNIIFAAVEEAGKNNHKIFLNITDISIIGKNAYTKENVKQVLSCLAHSNISNIKSIYIRKPEGENLEQFWQCIEQTKHSLQKLILYKYFDNADSIQRTIEYNSESLQCIHICGTMSPILMRTLKSVKELHSFGFCSMKMSHETIENFCAYLSTSQHFKEIRMLWLDCETHPKGCSECGYSIDISHNHNLKRLEIASLCANEFKANFAELLSCEVGKLPRNGTISFLKNLQKATKLECFGCRELNDNEEFNKYFDTIQKLENMQKIEIWQMDFTIERLQLSQSMKKLKEVTISGPKMTTSALRSAINSLPEHSVHIILGSLGNMVLADDRTGDFLTDIRRSSKLENLISDSVEYNEGCRHWDIESFVFDYNNKS